VADAHEEVGLLRRLHEQQLVAADAEAPVEREAREAGPVLDRLPGAAGQAAHDHEVVARAVHLAEAHAAHGAHQSGVRSPAQVSSIVWRRRISSVRSPWTITSATSGRPL